MNNNYDYSGISQLYGSRFENQNWKTYQLSHWVSFSWDLNKYGTIESEVRFTIYYFGEDYLLAQYSLKL